jgi:hypothetical protein
MRINFDLSYQYSDNICNENGCIVILSINIHYKGKITFCHSFSQGVEFSKCLIICALGKRDLNVFRPCIFPTNAAVMMLANT